MLTKLPGTRGPSAILPFVGEEVASKLRSTPFYGGNLSSKYPFPESSQRTKLLIFSVSDVVLANGSIPCNATPPNHICSEGNPIELNGTYC